MVQVKPPFKGVKYEAIMQSQTGDNIPHSWLLWSYSSLNVKGRAPEPGQFNRLN